MVPVLGEQMRERLTCIDVPERRARIGFASSVRDGLTQHPKILPSRFFYDEVGSELFEEITELPEYYLTRCEASIIDQKRGEILDTVGPPCSLIEFGSGSSNKTRQLIESILARQPELDYFPIDISREFLHKTAEGLLQDYSGLRVTALAGEYFDAAAALPQTDCPRLILFLGSNIGNFENEEAVDFLSQVAGSMNPLDRLLVGTDLVKDPAVITSAYNDAAGITEEFNFNILRRINKELAGRFLLDEFAHRAPFVEATQRVEMHLVSLKRQRVCIEALDLPIEFAKGETIRTEISQKYTEASFGDIADRAGLEVQRRWTDDRGWFALNLLRRSGA